MSIACKLRPIGGEALLPNSYRRCEYLESTGIQWMVISFTESIEATAKIDLQFMDAPKRGLMGFNSNSLYFGVNPDKLPYYWEPYVDGMPNYLSRTNVVLYGSYDDINNYVEIGGISYIRHNSWGVKLNQLELFSLIKNNYPTSCRIYSCFITNEISLVRNLIPCLDDKGKPCMFDAVTRKLFYNAATTGPDFIAGMTWEQVRELQLPTTGGQLTLSLPYEASIDGIAQTALDRARANGWQLTLQYDDAEVLDGYIKLDFLESTGTQYIDTRLSVDNESDVECTFRSMTTAETYVQHEAIFGTRATYSEGITLFAPSSRISTAALIMGMSLDVVDNFDPQLIHSVRANKNELIFDSLSKVNSIGISGTYSPMLLFCVDTNPDETSWTYYYSKARIYIFNISRSNSLQLAYIPCLDQEGVPCMYDLVSHQSFYNKGAGQFVAGMTMKQALSLANLPTPTTSNTLTISLPKEASLVLYNQEVEAALERARANGWYITVQYRDEFEDEAILNKYAECTTIAEMEAVNPDYKNDLTSDGIWVYPIPAFRDANNLFSHAENMKGFDIDISHLTNIDSMFYCTGLEGEVVLEHPTITKIYGTLAGANAFANYSKVILNLPEAINITSICYHNYYLRGVSGNLDKVQIADNAFFGRYGADTNYILDFKSPLSALSSGAGMFTRQGLTKESVLLICNSIPSYTSGSHPLTLGIHKDYKTDPEVNLALKKVDINYEPTVELPEEVTEGKGWTLTVQWNGTATSTASTFDMETIIYAKVGEIEHPDGTTERILDWGHHVTDWEARGYEQFRSLESAYEYFGLTREIDE